MGSIFCCKFFKKENVTKDLEINDIKTKVEDPIKRKIEFNQISLTDSKKENNVEKIEEKEESTTNLNEKLEKINKDNENEEDDIITEDIKLKNIIENQPSLKEEKIENKFEEDKNKNPENIEKEKEEQNYEEDDSKNPLFQKEEKEIEKPKANTLFLSQGIENKINEILNQIDNNEKKTNEISNPIKIESQYKKVNT